MVASAALARKNEPATPAAELVESVHDVMKAFLHRSQSALEREGITMGQFWTLHLISSLESATVSSVARHLAISAPAVCTNLDLLEESGLVVRERSSKDRRTVEISITPKGRKVGTRIWAHIAKMMAEAGADLPPEDVRTATRVFRELKQRLDALPAPMEVAA
jgi:DNA-binding MarR family transcriptional regulator